MSLISFILICYGLTTILVWGKIFSEIRPNYEFFHCSHCVGFWVGVLIGFITGLFMPIPGPQYWFVNLFLAGCLSAGTSYILDSLFGDEGININIKFKSD